MEFAKAPPRKNTSMAAASAAATPSTASSDVTPARSKTLAGLKRLGYNPQRGAVGEEEGEDNMGMPPVRAGPARKTPARQPTIRRQIPAAPPPPPPLGEPITLGADLASLNPLELEMLDRFIKEARQVRDRIMQKHSFSRIKSVFLDGDLQKFGIYLPRTKIEMNKLCPESTTKVNDFGDEFLRICRKYAIERAENFEGADVPVRSISQATQGRQQQRQQQPQGTTAPTQVYEILDDDFDDDYGDDDFEDDNEEEEDDEEATTSKYFPTNKAPTAALTARQMEVLNMWREREGQAIAAASTNQRAPAAAARGRGGARGRGRGRGGGKKYGARRTSGESASGRAAGGVKMRGGAAAGGGAVNSSYFGGAPARGRGGGGAGGGNATAISGIRPMWG